MEINHFEKLDDALRAAFNTAPCGIAQVEDRWYVYDLTAGAKNGSTAEFLLLTRDRAPIPLTEASAHVFGDWIKQQLLRRRR